MTERERGTSEDDGRSVELVPVLAVSRNGVIGVDGRLPWHISADLRRFRRITTGHPIVMGRKTFVSIGRPLPERTNIVVTRDRSFAAEGVEVVHSIGSAVAAAARSGTVAYVIGGAEVYRETLPLARRVHLTLVDRDFEGDARLDPLDPTEWRVTHAERGEAPGEPPLRYAFLDLERVEPRGTGGRPAGATWAELLERAGPAA